MFGCVPRFFVLSTLPGSNGLLLPWPCPRWQQGRDREMMHGRETISHPQRRTRSGGTMRKSCLGWSVVTAALTLLTDGWALAQPILPTSFLAPTTAIWESTRGLVLGIAEIIPEDKYDFKPTPAVRTARENLIHLIGENYFFFTKVSGDPLPSADRLKELKSRDEILKELRASYDYGAKVWETMTEAKALDLVEGRNNQKVQRQSFILGAIQDNNNHYGNLVVYVRLMGLVPPRSANR